MLRDARATLPDIWTCGRHVEAGRSTANLICLSDPQFKCRSLPYTYTKLFKKGGVAEGHGGRECLTNRVNILRWPPHLITLSLSGLFPPKRTLILEVRKTSVFLLLSPPSSPSLPLFLPRSLPRSLSLGLGVVCTRQTGVSDLRSHGSGSVHTLELKEEFRQREEVEQARHSGVTVWSCSEAFSHLFIHVQTHASRDLRRLRAELYDPGRMFRTAVETPGFCSFIFLFFFFSIPLLPVGSL